MAGEGSGSYMYLCELPPEEEAAVGSQGELRTTYNMQPKNKHPTTKKKGQRQCDPSGRMSSMRPNASKKSATLMELASPIVAKALPNSLGCDQLAMSRVAAPQK